MKPYEWDDHASELVELARRKDELFALLGPDPEWDGIENDEEDDEEEGRQLTFLLVSHKRRHGNDTYRTELVFAESARAAEDEWRGPKDGSTLFGVYSVPHEIQEVRGTLIRNGRAIRKVGLKGLDLLYKNGKIKELRFDEDRGRRLAGSGSKPLAGFKSRKRSKGKGRLKSVA